MGVFSTYCQACGLPVQHEIAAPDADGRPGGRRGASEALSSVKFGPEHAWLKDAIAVRTSPEQTPAIVAGAVRDGHLELAVGKPAEPWLHSVGTGVDLRAAFHRVCWGIVGQPELWGEDEREPPLELEPYREPRFDFARLISDGGGWMLCDPRLAVEDGLRSRERIRLLTGM